MSDTIVALATPTGRSGIGVIRLSGRDAFAIVSVITGREFEPRKATLAKISDPNSKELIDEAVITYFKAPHSFTGEDIIEIACHGSPILLRQVIDICLASDARMAEPGEFSLRALASGRIDLSEAEAIRDLIDAQTTASARQAVRQMSGEFSHRLQPIKDELLDVIVVLESALEFVEDDLPETQTTSIKTRLNDVAAKISDVAATYKAGRLIRDGLRVAIIGRPNVGKSSLFNALLGDDRAIVTDIAGTTRDQIHERFTIGDVPISLIDTAGLRETTDTVESIGVERSRRTMADADLVLVMIDASDDLTPEDQEIIDTVRELPHLIVLNKSDKTDAISVTDLTATFVRQASVLWDVHAPTIVATSAKTGSGLDALQQAIVAPFKPEDAATAGFLVTDARHHDLLTRSAAEIRHSVELLDVSTSEEIVLIGLHNALRYLGQITGETTTEDMLTRIFSTFCIGK